MNVLDGAMLDTDEAAVEERVDRGDVLVAVDDGRILGAGVLEPDGGAHVRAIAVRPRRRGQGIGRAMLEAAAKRHGRLTADFGERVAGFYESLGFEIEPDGERYVGSWEP
jgi:GNAT superfamily N-acetyltransferase